jgi:hypothetical protein
VLCLDRAYVLAGVTGSRKSSYGQKCSEDINRNEMEWLGEGMEREGFSEEVALELNLEKKKELSMQRAEECSRKTAVQRPGEKRA